jgi:hypothetical protein
MPSINIDFLNLLNDNYKDYPNFVETGTYLGNTIFAMEHLFNKLYTIELSKKYYTLTKSKYNGNKIDFILGDSSDVFQSLLPKISEKTIFFLDGHWSSGDTAKGTKDCPLIEEIKLINSLFKNDAIIIIDDYRLFGKGPTQGMNEDWTYINKDILINILSNRIKEVYFLDSEISKHDRLIIHINSCM